YRSKVIIVHSKQGKAESEVNTKLLLEVERADNPIEIVIHVDKLKEGWDVNNLYTIVPLRTAASKILREQMVGRGLRLPYGERTGNKEIDSVMLTAHDKFNDIMEEAQKGDSIFKAGNVIVIEDTEQEQVSGVQLSFLTEPEQVLKSAYEAMDIERTEKTDNAIQEIHNAIRYGIDEAIQKSPNHSITAPQRKSIVEDVIKKAEAEQDLAEIYLDNSIPAVIRNWAEQEAEKIHVAVIEKFIPIPRIKITDSGAEEYIFMDFELDLSVFNHQPISKEMLVQNLQDRSEQKCIQAGYIDFDGYNPKQIILEELCRQPEIDYNKCGGLIRKLIISVVDYYEDLHGTNGMQSIVMMYKKDIAGLIYKQMMQHFYCENGFIQEEVLDASTVNLKPHYTHKSICHLYDDDYKGDIRSVLFTGIKKGVFSEIKVDSHDGELTFARLIERDEDVKNWLRPAPKQFNITYNHGKSYEPDFVVETEDTIYLVEVKAENEMNDPDVIAKKKRGIQYCETVTRWSNANGYKPWKYLFIPANKIFSNTTFNMITKLFVIEN
ncbi:MAG: type III restriction endonuclease subunit R, partial [Ruminococcus sp.]|nr:type III restriction endonuclease subunit R [Ruminococcus sp.]